MKTITLSDAFLKTVFHGDAFSLLNSVTTFYVSLHTANPGQQGTQETNEVSYTSYVRAALARSSTALNSSPGIMTLVADVMFPEASAGSAFVTHLGIGVSSTGPGTLLYSGLISPAISINPGVQPKIGAGTTITES